MSALLTTIAATGVMALLAVAGILILLRRTWASSSTFDRSLLGFAILCASGCGFAAVAGLITMTNAN